MPRRLRDHLTYANVMATIAVFVALGGSSYAALSLTGSDIRNESLTGRDIRNGSIRSPDVKNRSLTGADIKVRSIPLNRLARSLRGPAGAAGPAGPAGPPGPGGGRGYQNVLVVAKASGDFTLIQSALDSIKAASESNRYLVRVAPGVYPERIQMRPYVDIEGSGEGATRIIAAATASPAATVSTASAAELRFLTVESSGSSSFATAIASTGTNVHLTHVTAVASGAGQNRAIDLEGGAPLLTDVTARAGGGDFSVGVDIGKAATPTLEGLTAAASAADQSYGVANSSGSSPKILNSQLSAAATNTAYGIQNDAAGALIQRSMVEGSGAIGYAVFNIGGPGSFVVRIDQSDLVGSTRTVQNITGFTTQVGASRLAGGPVAGGGTVTCAGTFDEGYDFFSTSCP